MNVGNPLDIGPSGLFALGMKLAMTDRNVDAVISMPIAPWSIFRHALETNPEVVSGERFVEAKLLEKAAERTLLVSLMGHPDWLEKVRRFFGTGAGGIIVTFCMVLTAYDTILA